MAQAQVLVVDPNPTTLQRVQAAIAVGRGQPGDVQGQGVDGHQGAALKVSNSTL